MDREKSVYLEGQTNIDSIGIEQLTGLPFISVFHTYYGGREHREKNEKFSQGGEGEENNPHLVKWCWVSKLKQESGLGMGNIAIKNKTFCVNGYGDMQRNQSHCGRGLLKDFMVKRRMDGLLNFRDIILKEVLERILCNEREVFIECGDISGEE